MAELNDFFKRIDEDFDEHVEETRRFLRQPSISLGDKETCLPDIEKSGKMLIRYIEDLGGEAKLVPLKEGWPVVYGKLKSKNPEARTLIIYCLYDVMPVKDEKWKVQPFSAEIIDADEIGVPAEMGKVIVCRGASNQKGPLMAWINALKSLLKITDDVPVNLIFAIESEEELGSIHLEQFVDDYASELKEAEGIIQPGMMQIKNDQANIYLGAKGILHVELEVKGGEWGGPAERALFTADEHLVDAPSWRLIHALSSLRNRDGKILIEGFHDNIRPLTTEEKELLQKLVEAFDEEGVKKNLGIKKFRSGSRRQQLEEYYTGPTLNISGDQCGYTGPYTKTNLPSSASVKMDIRFVPNQSSDEILRKLRAHLDNNGFGEVEIHKHAALSWYRTPPTADIVEVMVKGTKAMGIEPIVYPSGFWSDPCSIVAKPGNLYHRVVMFGAGGSGNYHSANEWVSVEGLRLCEKQFGAFLYQYGKK